MPYRKSKHVIRLKLRVHVERLASESAGEVSRIQILNGLTLRKLGFRRAFKFTERF